MCMVVATAIASAAGDTVERLDMQTLEGTVARITDEAVVINVEGSSQEIALADVASIRLTLLDAAATPIRLMDEAEAKAVAIADGSVLSLNGEVSIDSEAGTFTNRILGQVVVPLAQLEALWLGDGVLSPGAIKAACSELGLDAAATDQLVAIQDEGNLLPVAGVLISVQIVDSEGEVAFHWADEDRTIEIERVRAILLAGSQPPAEAPTGVVTLTDGSRVAFTSLTLDEEGMAALQSPILGELELKQTQVVAVEWFSERLVYLGELAPSEVTEYGQLLDTQSYRVDRSVSGKALTLDGVAYDVGLGVHSYSELSWQLDGQYVTFAALVGIDDSVRPRGNVTLTLLGDGAELDEPITVTGEGEAQIVRVDLTGVDVLTIRVDFGTDELEVSDHVNLVGARLIRVP